MTGARSVPEMWPGNTADVTTLVPVIDRLRRRFAITQVCVVADRGLISAATLAELRRAVSCISSAYASAPTSWCENSCWRIPRHSCRWS